MDAPTCAESLFAQTGAVSKVDVPGGARRRLERMNSDLPPLKFPLNEIDVGVLLESLTGPRRPL
jgi:hypothetical protein